jgi:hypothetical protein
VAQYCVFYTIPSYPILIVEVMEDYFMSDKKYFVLMQNGEDTSQVFVSKQPRGAALKAASREVPNPIQLRERGTNRVHNFEGWIERVDKPANGPDWLPAKINKANVKKTGITRL